MENNLELSIFPQNYMKSYEGANGNKICLTIHNEDYMVKFPANPTINVKNMMKRIVMIMVTEDNTVNDLKLSEEAI